MVKKRVRRFQRHDFVARWVLTIPTAIFGGEPPRRETVDDRDGYRWPASRAKGAMA